MLVAAMPAPSSRGLAADENPMLGTNGAVHLTPPSSGGLLAESSAVDKALGAGPAASHLGRHTVLFQDIKITEFLLNQCSD